MNDRGGYVHGGDRAAAASRLGIHEEEILDFSASVNPLGPPEGFEELLREAAPGLRNYPDPAYRELREIIGQRHGLSREQIWVGNGSSALLFHIPRVYRPRRALTVEPGYVDYRRAAWQSAKEVHPVVLSDPGELGERLQKMDPYDMAFVGNPGNPTGWLHEGALLHRVAESSPRTVFVVDEAFIDFLPKQDQYTAVFPAIPENLIVLRSFTKFYGIPGFRLGYAVSHSHTIARLREEAEPWAVSGLAEPVALWLFRKRDFEERSRAWLAEERSWMRERLEQIPGIRIFPSEVNFFLAELEGAFRKRFPSARNLREELLRSSRILIRDASNFFGLGPEHFRVAVRSRSENLRLIESLNASTGEAARYA
jgi:threonine-phosphate decarboxylase